MSRSILTALTAGAMLVAFAALPPMLPGSSTLSLSGSALAQKKDPKTDSLNLNSSRSNIYRMGGGGGGKTSSEKIKGPKDPKGSPKNDPADATTIRSSKSNGSF